MKTALLSFALTLMVVLGTPAASASQYSFFFNSADTPDGIPYLPLAGRGTFTTNSAGIITGLTGVISDAQHTASMVLSAPGTTFNNNVLTASSPWFEAATGVAFTGYNAVWSIPYTLDLHALRRALRRTGWTGFHS
jgi:hypothetical protein